MFTENLKFTVSIKVQIKYKHGRSSPIYPLYYWRAEHDDGLYTLQLEGKCRHETRDKAKDEWEEYASKEGITDYLYKQKEEHNEVGV